MEVLDNLIEVRTSAFWLHAVCNRQIFVHSQNEERTDASMLIHVSHLLAGLPRSQARRLEEDAGRERRVVRCRLLSLWCPVHQTPEPLSCTAATGTRRPNLSKKVFERIKARAAKAEPDEQLKLEARLT